MASKKVSIGILGGATPIEQAEHTPEHIPSLPCTYLASVMSEHKHFVGQVCESSNHATLKVLVVAQHAIELQQEDVIRLVTRPYTLLIKQGEDAFWPLKNLKIIQKKHVDAIQS